MPKPKIPAPKTPPQPVEVEWLDAAIYTDEGERVDPAVLRTVGYYFDSDRKHVWLAAEYDPEDKTVRTTHVLFRAHILKFRLLKGGAPDETL